MEANNLWTQEALLTEISYVILDVMDGEVNMNNKIGL